MTDVEPVVTDFAASGRAGRRNALPDILGSPAGAGTSDLPHKLAELSVSDAEGGEMSSSKTTLEKQETEVKISDS
uniref:cAMP-dependent protein kinase inhibitor n=1 Tax=Sphenodon punctatus TaxID=8508 RepID=A0A8D0GR21_SPHPU